MQPDWNLGFDSPARMRSYKPKEELYAEVEEI
jgi:hypothetical protein